MISTASHTNIFWLSEFTADNAEQVFLFKIKIAFTTDQLDLLNVIDFLFPSTCWWALRFSVVKKNKSTLSFSLSMQYFIEWDWGTLLYPVDKIDWLYKHMPKCNMLLPKDNKYPIKGSLTNCVFFREIRWRLNVAKRSFWVSRRNIWPSG